MESKVEGIMKVFTNHPLHVVVEGLLGLGASSSFAWLGLCSSSSEPSLELGCSAACGFLRFLVAHLAF